MYLLLVGRRGILITDARISRCVKALESRYFRMKLSYIGTQWRQTSVWHHTWLAASKRAVGMNVTGLAGMSEELGHSGCDVLVYRVRGRCTRYTPFWIAVTGERNKSHLDSDINDCIVTGALTPAVPIFLCLFIHSLWISLIYLFLAQNKFPANRIIHLRYIHVIIQSKIY